MQTNTETTEPVLVEEKAGIPKTTSLRVAAAFEKRHCEVLRSIRELDCSEDFNRRNFASISYRDELNREQPFYEITRDGFSLMSRKGYRRCAALLKQMGQCLKSTCSNNGQYSASPL